MNDVGKVSIDNMKRDYVIVGSGLTGAVIARKLADAGKDIIVVERPEPPGW